MPDPLPADLANAYFDGHLAETDVATLEAALCADADFRRWFASQCRHEVALRATVRKDRPSAALMQARKPGRPRFLRTVGTWSLTAAAVVLAFIAGLMGAGRLAQDDQAMVTVATVADGMVEDATLRRIAAGDRLQAGDRLHIAGTATLRFAATDATVEIRKAIITVRADGLRLEQGEARATVTRQPPDRHFRIGTPHAVVTVTGTHFTVDVTSARTAVAVQEGVVEVSSASGTRRFRDGESASWSQAMMPTATPPTIIGIALLDADRDRPVAEWDPLIDDAVIDLARLPSPRAGLRIDTADGVRAVRTTVAGPSVGRPLSPVEQVPPFTYPGNRKGDIDGGWKLVPGTYVISVQAFADSEGRQPLGRPWAIRFTVIDSR